MENKVLATVGNVEITEAELNNVIANQPQERQMMFDNDQAKKQLLEQMIALEVMALQAKEEKLDERVEYKETLERFGKELLAQMAMGEVLSKVIVTDEDVKAFYEENKENFVEQPTVSAKHILVENEEEANKIKSEIEAGDVTFEEAAAKYSTCPSKEAGGNLGAFGKGMMVPEFEAAAFDAVVGEVTAPVKTQFGYHIIKVEAKNGASEKSFDEVKDGIKQQLTQQKQQEAYLKAIKELETKFGVVRK